MPRVMVQKGQHFEISATRGEELVRRLVLLQFMTSKLFENSLKIWNISSSTRGNVIDLNVDFIVLVIKLVSYVLNNLVFVDLCYSPFSIFFCRLKEQKNNSRNGRQNLSGSKSERTLSHPNLMQVPWTQTSLDMSYEHGVPSRTFSPVWWCE